MSTVSTRSNCDAWCITDFDSTTYTFLWIINKFSNYVAETPLRSSTFCAKSGTNESKWELDFEPGLKEEENGSIGVFLYLVSQSKPQLVIFTVSFLDAQGNRMNTLKSERTFSGLSPNWGWDKFITRKDLLEKASSLLPNDALTICLDLCVRNDSTVTRGDGDLPLTQFPDVMSADFGTAFDNELFSDVTLVVGEQEFQAHKFVLGARSPVFRSMLQTSMNEKLNSVIEIEDIDATIFQQVLRYMYTGKTPDMANMKTVEGILYAADKYFLCDLKQMCEVALCQMVNLENIVTLLFVADKYNLKLLLDRCISFSVRNIYSLTGTKEWKTLEESLGSVALDILRRALVKEQR